ncbi:class I SAM-dependent methyltransferase [bacterium]|nr:class I SAM-dependent methyltransferase [bacterium]
MPYAHHSDPAQKWRQQYLTTKHHILPFILRHHTLPPNAKILEIGCGEGGVLKAFAEAGFLGYGIDISESRIEHGKNLLQKEIKSHVITLYAGDIYDSQQFEHMKGEIDLIVLKDAIEHIPDQQRILDRLHGFLHKRGAVFLAFPPWLNPFGGHQQLAVSFLKYVPWFHIFPRSLYQRILKLCGEPENQIRVLLEIYDTRLSSRRFERILQNTNWRVATRQFYLFNPGYEFKFGIKPKEQLPLFSSVPVIRDLFSTAVFYLVVE